jgi:hypothetical protein
MTYSLDNLTVNKSISVLRKIGRLSDTRATTHRQLKKFKFLPHRTFRQSRFGYPTLQHISKPAQKPTARPKACKRAAISHPPHVNNFGIKNFKNQISNSIFDDICQNKFFQNTY